jgi:hypothetical protein
MSHELEGMRKKAQGTSILAKSSFQVAENPEILSSPCCPRLGSWKLESQSFLASGRQPESCLRCDVAGCVQHHGSGCHCHTTGTVVGSTSKEREGPATHTVEAVAMLYCELWRCNVEGNLQSQPGAPGESLVAGMQLELGGISLWRWV